MKKEFKDTIRESFKEPNDILTSIKSDQRFKIPEKTKHSIFSFRNWNRYKMSFASIFVIALLVVIGMNLRSNTQVYASTVTIDINPSIEITLDENDQVIEVRALNDDGDTLIEHNITYRKMSIEQVIRRMINRAIELNYITEDDVDNVLYIHVEGVSEQIISRVRTRVVERINQEMMNNNRMGHILRSDQFELTLEQRNQIAAKANELNITPGKMIYIFSIDRLDVDDEYSLVELSQMTMRQLYRIEQQLKQKGNQHGN